MTAIDKAKSCFSRSMAVLALFSICSNLLLLTTPLYLLQVYDRVIPSQSEETLLFLTLAATFAVLVLGLLEAARSMIAHRMAAGFDIELSETILGSILTRDGRRRGDVQPLRDLANVRGLLSSRGLFAILDLPFVFLFIGILFLVHPSLFWLATAGAAVLCVLVVVNQLCMRRAARDQHMKSIDAAMKAEQFAANADSLVAMGMIRNVFRSWEYAHGAELRTADFAARINGSFSAASRVIRLGLQIAILGLGAKLVLSQEMNAGMIFAASLLANRGLQPIDQLIGSWRPLFSGWQSWKAITSFLGKSSGPRSFTQLPEPAGHLSVNNLFVPNPTNPAQRPILSNISFELHPGEVLAVVGPSGSGKSSLAKAVAGVLRPKLGEIRLDGHEIGNWDPETRGRYFGYMAQEVGLLSGTVAQNICRFDDDAENEAIIEAARRARVEEIVQNLPQGFDTQIGAGGIPLSGGEMQRIALARAFYGAPRLLVLDEPNSSLDQNGEAALCEALENAKKSGIAVLIVTQRGSALKAADRILRMQDGKIAEMARRRPTGGNESAATARTRPIVSARFGRELHTMNEGSR